MCYSRYWEAEEAKRREQLAKEKEAQDKRSDTINGLLADAEKQAQRTTPEDAPVREAAPAK